MNADRQTRVLRRDQRSEVPWKNFHRPLAGDLSLRKPLGGGFRTLRAGDIRWKDVHRDLDGLLAHIAWVAAQIVEPKQAVGVIDRHLASRRAIHLVPETVSNIRRPDTDELAKDHEQRIGIIVLP